MAEEVRGTILNAYLKFVKKKWGSAGVTECLADIDTEGNFKDGKYYKIRFFHDIVEWIANRNGDGLEKEAGVFVVQNLGLLAWFVRFAKLNTILERYPENYNETFTFGKAVFDTNDNNKQMIRIYDINTKETSCRTWQGVCEGLLAITKTKGAVTETKCRLKGDEYCEYTFDVE